MQKRTDLAIVIAHLTSLLCFAKNTVKVPMHELRNWVCRSLLWKRKSRRIQHWLVRFQDTHNKNAICNSISLVAL